MNRWLAAALSIPLFWKILAANAAVVVAAALLGGTVHAGPGALAWLAVAGVSLSLLVNAALLRLALDPLESLQQAAARVQLGDLDARAPKSPFADRAFRRLAAAFNGALDELAASRRRVRALLARSMQSEEAERRRVAESLEEDAAQRLAGLLVRVRIVARHPDPVVMEGLLEESLAEIARALEVVRGYAAERRPAVLADLGLVAALQAEARRIRAEDGASVRVDGEAPTTLGQDVELVLYRVLSQALDGAVRHGGARSVLVRVSNGAGRVKASVEDDGWGFDASVSANGRETGIADMRERVESVGGSFSLWSAPDRGARVDVEVPV